MSVAFHCTWARYANRMPCIVAPKPCRHSKLHCIHLYIYFFAWTKSQSNKEVNHTFLFYCHRWQQIRNVLLQAFRIFFCWYCEDLFSKMWYRPKRECSITRFSAATATHLPIAEAFFIQEKKKKYVFLFYYHYLYVRMLWCTHWFNIE